MSTTMSQTVTAVLYLSTISQVSETPPAPCHFFRLPSELKLEILNYIDSKRDLLNVSKTCRWLEDVALGRLYNTIDLEIPSDKSYAWRTGEFVKLRPHVVHAVQEITVRDGFKATRQPQLRGRRGSTAGCPESYTVDMIQGIPFNRLKSLLFMPRSPLSARLFQLLILRHAQSLQHFSCYELAADPLPPNFLPNKLETLRCRSVENGETFGRLVHASRDTLHTLQIGQERALVNQYHKVRSGFYEDILQPLQAFQSVTSFAEIKNLRSLSLVGLDLTPLVPSDIESALHLTQLKELTMESCKGNPDFLSALTSIFTYAQSSAAAALPLPQPTPQLEKFAFRSETPSTALNENITQFLASFTGLRTLSLLFENGSIFSRPQHLIGNHNATLECLVLESRIQPRESLRLDTSRPFGGGAYSQQLWEEGMNEVCQLCPRLAELGVGFPWNDEMVRIRPSRLPLLKRLRTMHIRNFPESQSLAHMGDYSIKEHAIKFVEWTYGGSSVQGGERPQLETLSIGPGIYESHFRGSNPNRQQVPEFLRTHHFMLDWAQTRFGRWSAMITSVSDKFMEEHRGEKPLGGVFEPLWLR